MNRIFGIFFEPFPLEDDRRIQFLHSIIISLITVAFLYCYKPFDLDQVTLPLIKLIPLYLSFGLVTFITCIAAYRVIRPAFPSFFDDQLWNMAKHITWTVLLIMLIGLNNLFFSRVLGITGISGTSLLVFMFKTFAITILPVILITMIRRMLLLSKHLKAVRKINENIGSPVKDTTQDGLLVFNADNGTESIRLHPDQFLYAESSDNYTDIVYVENAIIRRALIRSSLKRIEEMNTAGYVIRVHRAFLVNMRKVKRVKGNPQGFRLVFENVDESVPVARRNSSQVKNLLMTLHKQV